MMFIDGPSLIASVSVWEEYLERLAQLNQRDVTVVSETKRAHRIIKLLREEEAKDAAAD